MSVDSIEKKMGISKLVVYPVVLSIGLYCTISPYFTPKGNIASRVETAIEETEVVRQRFEPGEHTISVPINNPLSDLEGANKKVMQYPSHEGYRCVGLNGDEVNGFLVYTNVEPVWCESNGYDENNENVFTDFGYPELERGLEAEEGETKVFQKGEHILSIPISNPQGKNQQYPHYDGYEVCDVCSYTFGDLSQYGGACALYVNTEPVKCEKNIDGYTNFGIPVELSNEKTL